MAFFGYSFFSGKEAAEKVGSQILLVADFVGEGMGVQVGAKDGSVALLLETGEPLAHGEFSAPLKILAQGENVLGGLTLGGERRGERVWRPSLRVDGECNQVATFYWL